MKPQKPGACLLRLCPVKALISFLISSNKRFHYCWRRINPAANQHLLNAALSGRLSSCSPILSPNAGSHFFFPPYKLTSDLFFTAVSGNGARSHPPSPPLTLLPVITQVRSTFSQALGDKRFALWNVISPAQLTSWSLGHCASLHASFCFSGFSSLLTAGPHSDITYRESQLAPVRAPRSGGGIRKPHSAEQRSVSYSLCRSVPAS